MSRVTKEKIEFDEDLDLTEEELRVLGELDDDLDFDLEDDLPADGESLWDEAMVEEAEASLDDLNDMESALVDELSEDDPEAFPPAEQAVDDFDGGEQPPIVGDEDIVSADGEGDEGDTLNPEELISLEDMAMGASSEEDEEFEDIRIQGEFRPVPRINIDVFCESSEFSDLMEKAAKDRRLTKTHVSVMSGGVAKAAEYFRNQNTPNLVILETIKGGEELMQGLAKLAEVCDPSTRVVIVGHINDIKLYRSLIEKGVSEYLVTPRSPLTIIKTISDLYVDPSAPPVGRNIVFVGARGGVGSSTLCHNIAWSITENFNSDAILLDLDLPFGTASLDLEQDPSQGLAEALASPERLDDVLLERLLQKCTDRLSLFAAPNLLERDYKMDDDSIEAVLDIVRAAAPNIIIDLPHVWNSWSRKVLQSADEIVITATPDLASFRNVKNIVEALSTYRTNDGEPVLVLNQTKVPKRTEVPAEQFKEALGFGPSVIIDWDPQLFADASANGQTLMEVGPKSAAANAVTDIAAIILGQKPVQQSRGFSLSSLFSKR